MKLSKIISLFSGVFKTDITGSPTANRVQTLQDKSGTIALREDFASPPSIGSTTPNTIQSTLLDVTGAAGTVRQLRILTNGITRWSLYGNNGAESGSNAGTDLRLSRYADNGSYLGDAVTVERSTGSVMVPGQLTINNGTLSTTSATGAVIITGVGGLGVGGAINAGDVITSSKNVAGLLRSLFVNSNASASRRSDIGIQAGTQGIYLGLVGGSYSYLDNLAGGAFYFLNSGATCFAYHPSGGVAIGTNAATDPGATNLAVQGFVSVGSTLAVTGLASLTTLKVGANGSTLSRINTATTTSFNNVAVAANSSTTTTLTITGINTTDIVMVAKISAANPNFDVDGFVSVAGTVTVTLYNRAATSQTFSGSIRAIVFG